MSKVIDLTDLTVEAFIQDNPNTILVFKASWCGPCRAMAPVFDDLSVINDDIVIGRMDIESELDSRRKYEINSIPAIMFFKDGVLVDKRLGVMSRVALQNKIDELKS